MNNYQLLQNHFLQRIVIFFIAFGIYINSIEHDYVLEDKVVITENDYITEGFAGIGKIISHNTYQAFLDDNNSGQQEVNGHYRPLSVITFAIEYEYFGFNSKIGHIVNVLIYALIAVLLLITLQRMFYKRLHPKDVYLMPFIATLIFVCHPVHTEVVVNIKERDELLSFFFMILTIYFLLLGSDRKPIVKAVLIFPIMISFLLALLSKETAIVLVLIIPLVLYCFTNLRKREFILLAIPFWAFLYGFIELQAFFSIESVGHQGITPLQNPLINTDFVERYSTIVYSLGKYLQILLFPHPLTHDYSFSQIPIKSWYNWEVIVSALIFSLGTIASVYSIIKRRSLMGFGFLFFIGTLIAISLINNLLYPTNSLVIERFLFLPSLGFAIGITFLLHRIALRFISSHQDKSAWVFKVIGLSALGICTIYTIKTVMRSQVWSDNFTLYKHDVQYSPNSAKLQNNLGGEYIHLATLEKEKKDSAKEKEYLEKALIHLDKAINIYPNYETAWVSIGRVQLGLKNDEKAIMCYKKALEIDKRCVEAYEHIGKMNILKGNYEEAEHDIKFWVVLLSKTKESKRKKAEATHILADLFLKLGNSNFAIATYHAAIKQDSTFATPYIDLGLALEQKSGSMSLAIQNFKKALKYEPNNPIVLRHLGLAYSRKEGYEVAIDYLLKAREIEPKNAEIHLELADAYRQKGDSIKAQDFDEQAQALGAETTP
jgi:tetratricopeptide (TPR) repeat protein